MDASLLVLLRAVRPKLAGPTLTYGQRESTSDDFDKRRRETNSYRQLISGVSFGRAVGGLVPADSPKSFISQNYHLRSM